MAKTLYPADTHQWEQGDDWHWCVGLFIPSNPGGTIWDSFFWTQNTTPVVYARTYEPYPFVVSNLEQDNAGSIQEYTLSFPDGGFVRNILSEATLPLATVNIFLLNQTAGNHVYLEMGTGSIQGYSISQGITVLSCASTNLMEAPCPSRSILRNRCSFLFRGDACGYTGVDSTCDFSLDGENGCKAKSNEARFGGFPSLPLKV